MGTDSACEMKWRSPSARFNGKESPTHQSEYGMYHWICRDCDLGIARVGDSFLELPEADISAPMTVMSGVTAAHSGPTIEIRVNGI